MGEKRYIISDASKMVDVESHVLRYWEEELAIDIPRNEMGHRYYTDFHINLLKKVKELKESGFQLKAIKMLIPELLSMEDNNDGLETLKDELFLRVSKMEMKEMEMINNTDIFASNKEASAQHFVPSKGNQTLTKSDKMKQFQLILAEVVNNALKENTENLGKEVSEMVSDNVIKEMDYLMHIREKQEEERFKKLDETIRNYQNIRKETASKSGNKLFGKFKKGCHT